MSKRWYVVHTYSGYENRVKSDLEHRIETMGMQDRIFDIEIPMERVTEIKEGGKRETKDSKIFPGYVLVRMEMDDDAWTCVRNTPGVTGPRRQRQARSAFPRRVQQDDSSSR